MTAAFLAAQDRFLTAAGLDLPHLQRLLEGLMGPGVDAADLYFQHSVGESWSLEDGIVKSGSHHIEQGVGVREALIEAGAIRLRPILMTTLALIAGMIPVALGLGEGADFRAPLGRAVIGGTITSTILTLFVIPTVYEIFDGWREGLSRRFRRRHPEATPALAPQPLTSPPQPVVGD